MTRLRNKPTADVTDGGALRASNRPPAHLLSKEFQTLFAELDTLDHKRGAASNELADLMTNWVGYEDTARRADGLETATSARSGNATTVTTRVDALSKKQDELQKTIKSLNEAERLIRDDLQTQREHALQNMSALTKAEKAAREQLAKDFEAATISANNLAAAIAMREWLTDHCPYDDSANLNITEVWDPAAHITSTADRLHPVRLTAITKAITNL